MPSQRRAGGLLTSAGAAQPSATARTVITASAEIAPPNTVSRACRMAMIAAMKNVCRWIHEGGCMAGMREGFGNSKAAAAKCK